ncbi:MAG: TIR domain-containing protein [Eubacterium sp.]|nr:TIR domain-containing protein [Eubacterium sp.]
MDREWKPYIFISYSHKDEMLVHPSIKYLEKSGYRLWYDHVINPGAEWPEVIAEHLDKSAVFLAFISLNSLESHNCRREFNFAMMENKPAVTVILEPVMFTPVMKMQLASIQALYRYQFASDEEYYNQLGQAEILQTCKNQISAEPSEKDSLKQHEGGIVLRHLQTGERIAVTHDGFKIGRSRKQCDYAVTQNLAVSRVHVAFQMKHGAVYVTDSHSTNRTYLNGEEIEDGESCLLKESDQIELGGEIFIVEEA